VVLGLLIANVEPTLDVAAIHSPWHTAVDEVIRVYLVRRHGGSGFAGLLPAREESLRGARGAREGAGKLRDVSV
jgi:hypothetical protein